MQKIRIVIRDGKVQRVEINEKKPKKNIPALLRSMPKDLLAKALNIPQEKEDSSDV